MDIRYQKFKKNYTNSFKLISLVTLVIKKGDKIIMYLKRFFHYFIYLDSKDVYATSGFGKDPAANKKRLDSLRNLRCPRLMSSAAEYYRNRLKQTVKI
ncbi:MAG: hypothetical protein CM15mP106_5300 [Candidatus Neomarinimicrobiota bacterium]|nr:MAG: hypothetical protein CM15mP106_5300 [Candidatus Neomarinimicrobiota bacterium]